MPGKASPSNAVSISRPVGPGGAPCCCAAREKPLPLNKRKNNETTSPKSSLGIRDHFTPDRRKPTILVVTPLKLFRKKTKKKGRRLPAPTLRLRYATMLEPREWFLGAARPENGGAVVLVRRRDRGLRGREVRRLANGRLGLGRRANGVRDFRPAQAEIGQFAVGHAEELSLGRAQPEVRLHARGDTAVETVDPQDAGADRVSHGSGARVARLHLDQATVGMREPDLGKCVSPRRRSFAGQTLKHLDRLGHHGKLLQWCSARSMLRLHSRNIGA